MGYVRHSCAGTRLIGLHHPHLRSMHGRLVSSTDSTPLLGGAVENAGSLRRGTASTTQRGVRPFGNPNDLQNLLQVSDVYAPASLIANRSSGTSSVTYNSVAQGAARRVHCRHTHFASVWASASCLHTRLRRPARSVVRHEGPCPTTIVRASSCPMSKIRNGHGRAFHAHRWNPRVSGRRGTSQSIVFYA